MKYKLITLIVLFWASTLLAAVIYLSTEKIKSFDHNQQLAVLMADMAFDQRFSDYLTAKNIELKNTVIQFTARNCFCQTIAQPHINSVKKLANHNRYHHITLSVDEHQQLRHFIPSIPAVAVFNKTGVLTYLGPYSTGMYCSPNQGLVEKFIPAKDHTIGATIINEAQGCYCNLNAAYQGE